MFINGQNNCHQNKKGANTIEESNGPVKEGAGYISRDMYIWIILRIGTKYFKGGRKNDLENNNLQQMKT